MYHNILTFLNLPPQVEEVDLSLDTNDWANRLNDDERHFIQMVLAFFAGKNKMKIM